MPATQHFARSVPPYGFVSHIGTIGEVPFASGIRCSMTGLMAMGSRSDTFSLPHRRGDTGAACGNRVAALPLWQEYYFNGGVRRRACGWHTTPPGPSSPVHCTTSRSAVVKGNKTLPPILRRSAKRCRAYPYGSSHSERGRRRSWPHFIEFGNYSSATVCAPETGFIVHRVHQCAGWRVHQLEPAGFDGRIAHRRLMVW
ncbi:hypothetical protein FHX59_002557 [Paraburkholderia silvatlantica]|uniref:Uncharacterized protein n=1 Tax=Paraburkholderia silvatlantica TaxID=321895 RepID=A0ABR6FL90_9BURK|nr:hypothetical protein [Paraburkholderia silvatlantica]PVY31093.1 hypothetical protein C7411_112116 [Paraburkholderia silvatlantica]PXW37229.1 hypothetical protein C7413_112116 [Paraburkholderia silvatlantica]